MTVHKYRLHSNINGSQRTVFCEVETSDEETRIVVRAFSVGSYKRYEQVYNELVAFNSSYIDSAMNAVLMQLMFEQGSSLDEFIRVSSDLKPF